MLDLAALQLPLTDVERNEVCASCNRRRGEHRIVSHACPVDGPEVFGAGRFVASGELRRPPRYEQLRQDMANPALRKGRSPTWRIVRNIHGHIDGYRWGGWDSRK